MALLLVLAFIVGVNVYSIIAARLAGNAIPMPFGVGAAVVLSGSMEPELSTGDLIFIKERGTYEVGDVIVYQDGNDAITHRIIEKTENSVTTQGDANTKKDKPIHPKRIKGEVVFAIPYVGFLVYAIKTPVGTLLVLGAAILLLERSFRKTKEEGAKELDAIRAQIEKLKDEQNKNS